MKLCPDCGREYDNTMMFCLDDGSELLYGPAPADEPQTAILHDTDSPSEAQTRAQIHTTEQTAVLKRLPAGASRHVALRKNTLMAAVLGIILITSLGLGSYLFYGRSSSPQIESIAVMPFLNGSGDQDVEYLSDGMTDTLISSLSQIPGVNIKARSSVFRYKGKDVGIAKIGEELGVQAVLTGRVTQRGDQIALSVELVEVTSENIIWSRKYDRTLKDLVALQNEIADDVLTRIKSTLSGNADRAGSGINTENPEAYTAYLKGLYHYNRRERQDYHKAAEYFRQAIELDRNYALPYVGLANTLALAADDDTATESRAKQSFEALEKARSLAPDSSEVHASLANHYLFWKLNWEKAESEFQTAIKLNPGYATVHHWYGEALCYMGRFEECFSHFRKALEIDPLSLVIISDLGRAYFWAGKYDDAKKELERAITLDPDFARSYDYLSAVYEETGELEKAAELRDRPATLGQQDDPAEQEASELIAAFRASGSRGYWKKRLEQRLKRDQRLNISSHWKLANIYSKLGEKEKALEQLRLAMEKKWYATPTLWVDPALDPLRSDTRFDELLDGTRIFDYAQNKRR